jgi:hypothetical protein
VWNEITTTGTAAPVSSSSAASGGIGY